MSIHEEMINYCRVLAGNSVCKKMKVGAVVLKDGTIVSRGWNFPYDNQVCEPCLREGVRSGTQLERCRGVHAEQSCILYALQNKIDLTGGIMYVGAVYPDGEPLIKPLKEFSCTFCSRLLYQLGLVGVAEHTIRGVEILTMDEVMETSYKVALKVPECYYCTNNYPLNYWSGFGWYHYLPDGGPDKECVNPEVQKRPNPDEEPDEA